MVLTIGFEPMTSSLPRKCSTCWAMWAKQEACTVNLCICSINCPKCHINKQTTFRFLKVERVAGIEPASLAWKAKVLPLNYTRALTVVISNNSIPRRSGWWWGKDSNLRRHSRQIYSLIPLTAWVPHPINSNYILSLQDLFLKRVNSFWCRHEESNSGPSHYKWAALPAEL